MLQALSGCIVDGTSSVTNVPTQQNLALPTGEDIQVQVTVKGSNGSAINITGYSGTLTLKTQVGQQPIFSQTFPATLTTPASGVMTFTLPGTTTKTLQATFSYQFDVFTTNVSAQRDQVVPNSFIQFTAAVGA